MSQTSDEAGTKKRSTLTLRAVIHTVKRRPFTLLGVVVLAATAGAAVRYLLPLPKATAAVVFRVPSQAPILLHQTAETQSGDAYRQSQANLIKRRPTLKAVLKRPEVQALDAIQKQPDPLGWMENAIKSDFKPGDLMRVTIEGDNAEELVVILDALGKVYLAASDEQDDGTRRERLVRLEEAERRSRDNLALFQRRIGEIAKVLGSRDVGFQAHLDAYLRDDLQFARKERQVLREQILLEDPTFEMPGAPVSDNKARDLIMAWWGLGNEPNSADDLSGEVEAELRKDPRIRELEAQVAAARKKLSDTKERLIEGARTAAVISAENELALAEQKRDRERDELRPLIEDAIRKKNAQAGGRPKPERSTLEGLKKRYAAAKARVEELEKRSNEFGDYRAELDGIKASISVDERAGDSLRAEIGRLKLESGAPPRVTLSEEPCAVPGIEGNRRMKYTLLATLAVLFVGFGGVLMWDQRAQRLTHPDDVTALGLRLIGAVPAAVHGAGADPHPFLVEAVDATRTMLLNGTHDCDLRVLAVVSATPGEGKTSLSGHLAISLARAGFRTLLIDGDLRAPTAQRVFGMSLAPGLCEVLTGSIDAVGAARPTGVPNLSIMTAGEWGGVARQALAGDRWRVAKEQLKAEFDFVVVDTSPLLQVSDALLLAREADGVVVSVLMGVSELAQVAEAVKRLTTVRAKVTGVIVNGVRTTPHEYPRPDRPALSSTAPGTAVRV